MDKVRLEISYDGTDLLGWQKQSGDEPTVQSFLEKALKDLFGSPIQVIGAGRTDAGVHAQAQTAHFRAPKNLERYNIVRALNTKTPESISVRRAWVAPEDFHAQRSAVSKTYVYRVHTGTGPDPLKARYSLFVPGVLDLEKLNAYAAKVAGRHDFKSMQTKGTVVQSTVREIFEAQWVEDSPGNYAFRLIGNGFLKQMVRNIVGTILDLYRAGEPPEKIEEILSGRDRTLALTTAPPHGLTLESVKYPDSLDNKCRKL